MIAVIPQNKFAVARQLIHKFERPADFEPRLQRTRRVMTEIRDQIHLVELHSGDPETISAQLATCNVSCYSLPVTLAAIPHLELESLFAICNVSCYSLSVT